MYTLQQDSHGNMIVCKGDSERKGYCTILEGTYRECTMRMNSIKHQRNIGMK